jgi:hypothetical protein
MTIESERIIFAKLASLEEKVIALRVGFTTVNKRYANVLASLKTSTEYQGRVLIIKLNIYTLS